MNPTTAPKATTTKRGKEGHLTSLAERINYGGYFVGQNIFYILLVMFLVTFFTDIGIPAYTVAIVALIVKIWDAVNDPIFGGIVDRVKFRRGKFLPWLRISLIFIPLTTIAIFAIPSELSTGVKVAWAVISYILWSTAYTICDVPIFGLVTTLTNNLGERTTLIAIGRVSALLAAIVVTVVVPQIRIAIGGWLPTIILMSIIALFTMVPICFVAKERIEPVASDKGIGIRQILRFVLNNKYLLIFFLSILFSQATNLATTLAMYFSRYCLGDEELQSLFMLSFLGPTILVGILAPWIMKKVDKFHIFFWGSAFVFVTGFIAYFIGYQNFTVFMIVAFIRGIGYGITAVFMYMFTPDCAEYGFYRSGVSAPGISFSIQTFTVKLTGAIAMSLGALAVGLIGFIEGEGAVQLAGFNDKLWAVFTLIPTFGALLSLIPLLFYKLRDKDVQIMTKCNSGEISREEADRLLQGRYSEKSSSRP